MLTVQNRGRRTRFWTDQRELIRGNRSVSRPNGLVGSPTTGNLPNHLHFTRQTSPSITRSFHRLLPTHTYLVTPIQAQAHAQRRNACDLAFASTHGKHL